MSKVEITKITGATGTELPNFTNGFNIAGADSGISGFTHTESDTEPSSPSNGDTWWSGTASEYKVYANGAWQTVIGTATPSDPVASTFTKGQVIDHEDLENSSGFTGLHGQSQFNSDGTKWFGSTRDNSQYEALFEEWNLSTAYDLSTATFSKSEFRNLNIEANGLRAMTFNGDGTELLVWIRTPAGSSPRTRAYTFTLSTAYDISTLSSGVPSYVNTVTSFSDGNGRSYTWNNDGSVLLASSHTSRIYKVDVSTAYDLTTVTASDQLNSDEMGITTGGNFISHTGYGVGFRDNGNRAYILKGSSSPKLYETYLSTPYDITTGTLFATIDLSIAPYNISNGQNILMTPNDVIIYGNDGGGGGYKYTYINVTEGSSSSGGSGGGSATNSGDRGVFFGGTSTAVVNVIEYVDITTPGNAQDFGDLTETTRRAGACSNGTRGLRMGNVANPATVIDYVTIATPGNAQDFGDLSVGRYYCASFSDGTYGFTVGGSNASGYLVDTIDYVTIATTGNATDFGNTTEISDRLSALADSTRGVYSLGSTDASGLVNNLDYITTATPGNATDFGDMTQASTTRATGADATRGIFAQGYTGSTSTNTIEYITIQTTGNATDFGDATTVANRPAGCANSTRMLMAGGNGNAPNYTKWDIIAYITIQTTGNATDFGDLSEGKVDMGAFSGAAS